MARVFHVFHRVSGNRVIQVYTAVMVTLITILIIKECLR